jgi:hypothetical protein
MAGTVISRTYDALLTTTLDNYQRQLSDNIFDVYPLLSWLNGKLGRAMRGSSAKRLVSGGVEIQVHLLYGQNDTVKSYTSYEDLSPTPQEGLSIARFPWTQYSGTLSMSGLERRNNRGEAALLSLFKSKVEQLEMSLRDRMSRDAYGDGTGNAGKNMDGLGLICSNSSTLGQVSATGNGGFWQAFVNANGGAFASVGLSAMRTAYNTLLYGNQGPEVIFTTQSIFEAYEEWVQAQQRFPVVEPKAADLGFRTFSFKGAPMFFDRDCTSGEMYFLTSFMRQLEMVVNDEADFSTSPVVNRDDQDAWSSRVLWQGNLATNNRRKQGVIRGFT